jgi:hypothetical protein
VHLGDDPVLVVVDGRDMERIVEPEELGAARADMADSVLSFQIGRNTTRSLKAKRLRWSDPKPGASARE